MWGAEHSEFLPSSAAAARRPSNKASMPWGETSISPPLPSAPLQKLDTATATREEPRPACLLVFFKLQVSVVDQLGIPIKFVGVGEALEDLQPFNPQNFAEALFPKT